MIKLFKKGLCQFVKKGGESDCQIVNSPPTIYYEQKIRMGGENRTPDFLIKLDQLPLLHTHKNYTKNLEFV